MDWYFHIKRAPRVTPYLGVLGQFKIARIDSFYPYTGQKIVDDVPVEGLKYEVLTYTAPTVLATRWASQSE